MEAGVALIPLQAPELNVKSGGRKAACLHELLAAGFPVPAGFVVPADSDLKHIENELEKAVIAAGGYPVAVRSSAQVEDLDAASFAGQYTTHHQVGNVAELVQAIIACRKSAETPRSVSYLHKNGFHKLDARISVLVQRQVHPSVAGVTFSIHPESGREEHALVECCLGLGERLVSGQTSPTCFVLQLEDASVIERTAGAENVHLEQTILSKLCRYALGIQAHFGVPQDIEWAVDGDGEVWILQSRPITRICWRHDVGEFTNANFRDGGVSARICTPFMYSLYRDAFQTSMQQYFVAIKLVARNSPPPTWISMFYGRPYWSASAAKKALCRVPGYDEQRFNDDVGIENNYEKAAPVRTPTNLRTVLAAIPVVFSLQREFQRQLEKTYEYGLRFLPHETNYLRLLESCDALHDSEFFCLLSEVLQFHTKTDIDYLRTVYNHVNYQREFKKLLDRIQKATGITIEPLALMSGLRSISHMKLQEGLLSLVRAANAHGTASGEWDQTLSEFFSANYFHGDAELDISAPRWRECPDRIRQMVEGIQESGIDPKQPEITARKQFEFYCAEATRIRMVLRRRPWQRLRFEKSFCKRLKTSRTYALRREEMREYSMRADDLVRRYLLQAGRRLHRRGWLRRQEDIFMLHTDEIKAIADDHVSKEQILAASKFRELMYRGYRLLEPPGELGGTLFQNASEVTRSSLLKGTGCTAGKVTGKARVLSAPTESHSLMSGEILVTKFTDPAWTPIMGLVAGLITEVGGLLSHGAVIAREYGLPAVLNVPRATEIIKTGQLLEVDGSRGTVELLGDDASRLTSDRGHKTRRSPVANAAFGV